MTTNIISVTFQQLPTGVVAEELAVAIYTQLVSKFDGVEDWNIDSNAARWTTFTFTAAAYGTSLEAELCSVNCAVYLALKDAAGSYCDYQINIEAAELV